MLDFELCLLEAGSPMSHTSPIEFTSTSRKIGPSLHQVVSDFKFPVRYYPLFFPLDSFRVTVLESTKTLQKEYHCPRSILAFAISFQIRFVEFVSVVESCCWFSVFVVVVQSPLQFVCFRRYPIHLYPNNKSIHPITRLALASRLA